MTGLLRSLSLHLTLSLLTEGNPAPKPFWTVSRTVTDGERADRREHRGPALVTWGNRGDQE